ncbi:GerAB/ArcD/ProY family transporter [Heliobacterium chlorum]|uniref:GerAB/ArcD/ProY family transporter n=1 Tax=Heliobacterium chlorum TaxID=2698 RepID=A0ABR7T536_HELCL|nr:GerAB/ArcD/ProY family transporter [Heliobacterium chlorum]MBC9785197.1 GerAB/ArcD/ProY family transporter [Heliobacterium chlorum]
MTKLFKQDGHVGVIETFGSMVMFIFLDIMMVYPRSVTAAASTAAWQVPIVTLFYTIPFFYVLDRLLSAHPGKSFLGVVRHFWGKGIGTGIGLLSFILLISFVGYQVRVFGEFIITTILPNTPIAAIIIALILVMCALAYYGIETITRISWNVFPWIIVVYLSALALVIPFGNTYNLAPIWGNGILATMETGVLQIGTYKEIFMLGYIAPLFRQHRSFRQVGYGVLLFTTFLYVISEVSFIMVFPPPTSDRIGFPLYSLLRVISYGGLWQRLDPLFIFVWATMTAIGLAAGLYFCALIFAQTSRASDYRPYVFPLAVLLISVAFIPRSALEAVRHYEVISNSVAVPFFVLPLLLWIWMKITALLRRNP